METNGSNSNSRHDQLSESSKNPSEQNSAEKNAFVNHAEIAWHERRKQWVDHRSQKPQRMPRESISWTTTYEDLLCSTEPFRQPIPLAEMVDFLVDIWHEEGLYD